MEFQVEEHLEAFVAQRADDIRGAAGEQLLADLDPTQPGVELIGQRQRGITGREVQGNNDRGLAGGHGAALG
ncbi:hypothetical protein FQZ97_979050 [compost metagenome]